MAVTNSPNMTLPVPSVGAELGPAYAFDINSCLTLIDSHDHSPGRGVQITPAGLNINVDLPFNGNSATSLSDVVFTTQASATNTLQALSVAPGNEGPPIQDLWYTDSAGNKVQITSGGALAAVSTTVDGISYALGTFSFRQTPDALPTTPANLDAGTVTIRPNVAATPLGVALAPNAAIASQYTLNLPLPVANSAFVTQDPSGVLAGAVPVAAGIQQSMLANNSVGTAQIIDLDVTTAKINDAAVTIAKLAPIILTTASFGPSTPSGAPTQWYAATGNSVVLGAGQWKLTGTVRWTGSTNFFNDTRFGWFGANGANNSSTPAALTVASQQSGVLGQVFGSQIQGTNMLNYYASVPETIITLATPTTVFLDMFHGSFTGTGFTYSGNITAEQIRA